ncbi:MAG: Cof-type HAD-IIB family hydrolase [Oscillospiraceae bacterium]|nr:Cof-type HAD-IIB family hydrolase [Oscillospiraceae bacterium]
MGKFDGVLFASDYDDTLYNLQLTVSRENHEAIRYFMDNGGYFTVATGRAHRTFTPQIQRERLEFNAPVVLSNGACIYDYEADRYLVENPLGEEMKAHMAEVSRQFPELGFESYHGDDVYVWNPNWVTHRHLGRMGIPYTQCGVEEMPTPWSKVLCQQEHEYLEQVKQWIGQRFEGCCEAVFSNPYYLELTAPGCNKGTMVAEVARRLNISRENIYCIGDNSNDIPMLQISAIPFAPANCSRSVRDFGARILPHCDDHAVARAIEILDGIY